MTASYYNDVLMLFVIFPFLNRFDAMVVKCGCMLNVTKFLATSLRFVHQTIHMHIYYSVDFFFLDIGRHT